MTDSEKSVRCGRQEAHSENAWRTIQKPLEYRQPSTNSENNQVITIMIIKLGNLPDNSSVEAAASLTESPAWNNEIASSGLSLRLLISQSQKNLTVNSQRA